MADLYAFNEGGMRKLVEAFRTSLREMSNLKRLLTHLSTRRHEAVYMPGSVIKFHNASGEIVPAYAVMRVTAVGEDDDVHEIEKPNSTFKSRYLVNKGTDVAIDGHGHATWLEQSGKVLYSTGTPAIDEEWGAKTGEWGLVTKRPGFLITGGIDTTDTVIRAKQRIVTDLIGKPDSSIAKGSTGTVSIWMGAQGAEAVTEYDLTCSALGAAVTSAKYVVVFLRNGVWYVGPWECA